MGHTNGHDPGPFSGRPDHFPSRGFDKPAKKGFLRRLFGCGVVLFVALALGGTGVGELVHLIRQATS